MVRKHLRPSDARAVVQLATQATRGVTQMVEGVHQSVWATLGAPAGKTAEQTRGITGMVYQSIHAVTQLIGKGFYTALRQLEQRLPATMLEASTTSSYPREAVLAALNGVMGDRLLASANPFATPMTLRLDNQALETANMPDATAVTGKVLILIHGLCMNDLQWTAQHADALSAALGYTPVYVRYNTGLHISQNGAALTQQLAMLQQHWPRNITDITVLAHSMGGLVTRSALQQAQQQGLKWPAFLKSVIFLGTPHHGAPLERAGNWVDVLLGATPYSAPFKKLGQLRSAGITDLRYGLVQADRRTPVPLPDTIAFYTIAATTAAKRSRIADRLLGDGLVPLNSALGLHQDAIKTLHFASTHQRIVYQTNHMALLTSPVVTQQLLQWLGKRD
ncbi:MAG TPA: alpha/beta hydrolase [Burkholderiaceae bacterium]|nr:alpha/beta hydrolase [Burkholderiaceae bacterium]